MAVGKIALKVGLTFFGTMVPGFICGVVPKLFMLVGKLSEGAEVKPREILASVQGLQWDVAQLAQEVRRNNEQVRKLTYRLGQDKLKPVGETA